uniref:HMG box domain-containing protein n=1 Tax=Parastrongyloides trichosuri TaxID=131310 RepID=A0A0N4ZFE4_PARTI
MQNRSQHRMSSSFGGGNINIDPFSTQPPKVPEKPIVPELRYKKKYFPLLRNENPSLPVWEISDILSKKWEEIDDGERMIYYQEYEREKNEYDKQMKSYYSSPAFQQYNLTRQKIRNQFERSLLPNVGNNRKFDAAANGGVVVQPLEEDNPRDLNIKKLTAIRYSRNQLLMAELFSPNCSTDVRHIVTKTRLELFKKQEAALLQAISDHENEITRMQENLENRKRLIESNREEFNAKMKRLVEDDRPRCSDEEYNAMIEKWKEKFLTAYEEFEKKQQAQKEKLEHEREARPTLNKLLLEENGDSNVKPKILTSSVVSKDAKNESLICKETKKENNDEKSEKEDNVMETSDTSVSIEIKEEIDETGDEQEDTSDNMDSEKKIDNEPKENSVIEIDEKKDEEVTTKDGSIDETKTLENEDNKKVEEEKTDLKDVDNNTNTIEEKKDLTEKNIEGSVETTIEENVETTVETNIEKSTENSDALETVPSDN